MSRCDIRIIAEGTTRANPILASSRILKDLSKKWNELLKSAKSRDKGKDKENVNANNKDNKKIIFIPQIPHEIMKSVIRYINATFVDSKLQSFSICDENVKDYFAAGQFLEMEEIQSFGVEYLKFRKTTFENASFLFKLVGGFDNVDADNIITSKIRDVFMLNFHQLDAVVRKCKCDGISEDKFLKLLLSWLSSKVNLTGINLQLDLDLEKLLQEFSNLGNKFSLLEAYFKMGDLQVKNEAFHLLLNLAKNPTNSHHGQNKTSTFSQNGKEMSTAASLRLENFEVNHHNFENLPQWLTVQMNELEQNEEFPSFTFVNHCFFESEALRRDFSFISPLPTCAENQKKDWFCDPHSKCTNKFNLIEKSQPPVFIKLSNVSGIGLFAKSGLVEGQVVCTYTGKITKTCDDVVYPMEIFDGNRKKFLIDASEYGNLGRFANGELNATPNVVYDKVLGSSRALVVLTAFKEIDPGEEIIAIYGDKYWDYHNVSEVLTGPRARSSPVFFTSEAFSPSCKRGRIKVLETNTSHNNNSNSNTNEGYESDSLSTTSASSTIVSSAPEPKLQLVKLQQSDLKLRNPVSPPQRIIYFLLGTRQNPSRGLQFWSFNIKTQKFQKEGNLPQVFKGRRRLAMLHHNGDIYFMGGEDCESGKLTNEVQVFNLESQEWRLMEMVERRFDFKAAVLYNTIYVVGGCIENPEGPKYKEIGTNTVETLSLDSPCSKWERDSHGLIKSRSDYSLVALNGKIYAIGGCVAERTGGDMKVSSRCECFDPMKPKSNRKSKNKGQWDSIAPMNYKRVDLAAVATSDRIFALGGATSFLDSDKGLNVVEIYDPQTNSWTDGPPMNHPRKFFSAVLFDYCIYAIGGDDVLSGPTMEKFDLKTQKWTVECCVKADGNFATVAFR